MEMKEGSFICQDSFIQMVETHQPMLIRLCYVYLRDPEQARDAVQETFLKAYRALPSFRRECSEKNWLIRIAVNTCKSMQRTPWYRFVDKRITPDQLPLAHEIDTDETELMCEVLQLSPKLREAVLLYYWQEMGVQQIAELLEISQSSVSNRLRRARAQLKKQLERGQYHDGTERKIHPEKHL